MHPSLLSLKHTTFLKEQSNDPVKNTSRYDLSTRIRIINHNGKPMELINIIHQRTKITKIPKISDLNMKIKQTLTKRENKSRYGLIKPKIWVEKLSINEERDLLNKIKIKKRQ